MNDTLSMLSPMMFLGEYLRDADHLQASAKLATGASDAEATCNAISRIPGAGATPVIRQAFVTLA